MSQNSTACSFKSFWEALHNSGRDLNFVVSIVLNLGIESRFTEDDAVVLSKPDMVGSTPLILATLADRADVVQALLTAGASAKAANGKNYTPLHAAAESGNLGSLELLLDGGCRCKS